MSPRARSPRRIGPADVARQAMIQSLDVAPDGSAVVYGRRTVENGKYVSRLWRVDWRGGAPEQLTNGPLDGRPRFAPDGRSLVFVSRRDDKPEPWILPLAGGEARKLADLPGPAAAASFSPDSSRVLVLAPSGEERFRVGDRESPTVRRITELTWRLDGVGVRDMFKSAWVVPARGGRPVRVTPPELEVDHAFWSPDGRTIGFLADRSDGAALRELPHAWSIPAGGGRVAPLPSVGLTMSAAWSSAGVLALSGIDGDEPAFWQHPRLYVAERGGLRELTAALDRPLGNQTISDVVDFSSTFSPAVRWLDETSLLVVVSDRGASHPYRFGLDGAVERLAGGEIVTSGLANGGGRVAVVANDGGRPGEVYAVEDGELRALTRHGSRWLRSRRRDPERVSLGRRSGAELDAWILPARAGRRRGPLVLQIHGGPYAAYGPPGSLGGLALADAGYHVLYANPRGSMGYGERYAEALHGRWGEADTPDLMRALDWAEAEGLADPRRIGVMGGSYGGYMVNWLLGHRPGRFAAAVSENPVTDLLSFFGNSDFGWFSTSGAAGVTFPPDDPARILAKSPVAQIHRNEAPLLLIHAEADMRCPPAQTEVVFAILRWLGRPVEMLRYPEEPHALGGSGRPDRRIDRLERIIAWFDEHLARPRTAPPIGARRGRARSR